MNETVFMTARGRNVLTGQLEALHRELRDVCMAKGEAAEVGGNQWHDNFAFEQLCRDEMMLRRRIYDVEMLLQNAALPPTAPAGTVGIGCRVTIESDTGARREFEIVGHGESDPANGIVEYATPVARVLLGAEEGDEVEMRTPKLRGTWTIVRVTPSSNQTIP